jgi:hypothetical protein
MIHNHDDLIQDFQLQDYLVMKMEEVFVIIHKVQYMNMRDELSIDINENMLHMLSFSFVNSSKPKMKVLVVEHVELE